LKTGNELPYDMKAENSQASAGGLKMMIFPGMTKGARRDCDDH